LETIRDYSMSHFTKAQFAVSQAINNAARWQHVLGGDASRHFSSALRFLLGNLLAGAESG
jgi:hypothetical protein